MHSFWNPADCCGDSGGGDHAARGMALLADDLDGQGHKSTFTPDDAVTLFLVLPEDFDPTEWRIIAGD